MTSTSIEACARYTRTVRYIAVFASVTVGTLALIGTEQISARNAIRTWIAERALVHVLQTALAGKFRRTGARETLKEFASFNVSFRHSTILQTRAFAIVRARPQGAVILLLAVFADKTERTSAGVLVEGFQLTNAVILTGLLIAHVRHLDFAPTTLPACK